MRIVEGHPLDQLSGEEISLASRTVTAYLKARGDEQPRFNNITLLEPSRHELMNYEQHTIRPERTAHVICTGKHTSNPMEIDVALSGASQARVLSAKTRPGVTSIVIDEFLEAEAAMKRDPELLNLLARHGVPSECVVIDPWPLQAAPGEVPTEEKWLAGFMYWQPSRDSKSNHYAHPLPWLPIYDCQSSKVIRIDNTDKPCPSLNKITSEYHSELREEPVREGLRPISVTQPHGASFRVIGNLVQWQNWQFRIGFNYREGVVLHNIGYQDGGSLRPILHRMSLAEMCVPYGDPLPPFNKKLAFDAGDVGMGLMTNSLSLGCDCIGTVHYFDGIVSNSKGEPVVIKNAICLHEEDDGMSWKHTDIHTGHCELRRGRRLVVQFIATLANYEYALSWSFKTDASIAYDVKLTGILSTHTPSPGDNPENPEFASIVHPGVSAQFHQHLFCCRMDWALDDKSGMDDLVVSEVDVELLRGSRNTYGNAFVRKETDLLRESQAQRDGDASKARIWKIKNVNRRNPVTGQPVSFKLSPANTQTLLGLPGSATMTRAGFASKSLWVTEYSPEERWVGGKFPLQNPHPGGILEWVKQDRQISSPVMWYVFGTTHIPRPEDFPVMPVETVSFHLKPVGFFTKNPANDLPSGRDTSSVLYQPGQSQTDIRCHL